MEPGDRPGPGPVTPLLQARHKHRLVMLLGWENEPLDWSVQENQPLDWFVQECRWALPQRSGDPPGCSRTSTTPASPASQQERRPTATPGRSWADPTSRHLNQKPAAPNRCAFARDGSCDRATRRSGGGSASARPPQPRGSGGLAGRDVGARTTARARRGRHLAADPVRPCRGASRGCRLRRGAPRGGGDRGC
jgi:hypothetical protein